MHLADNSLIVLSTSELQAKTHIAGPQSLFVSNAPFANTGLWQPVKHLYKSMPLTTNPRDPKELLLAVPVDQSVGKGTAKSPSAPFLQSYNIQAGRHISRQALTRNLATESNIDADWNKLEVPDVKLMQISHDGLWLATSEEWMPPARDVAYLAGDKAGVEAERIKRRETYLKIWHWNGDAQSWSLNTRIANPHADHRNELANRTVHLAAHPTRNAFATIGEDNKVRIWRPRTRSGQTAWFAKSVTELGQSAMLSEEALDSSLPLNSPHNRLAYSNDGSILAVCLQNKSLSTSSVIQLLNSESGKVRATETGVVTGDLVAMGFLDRYLILVSDELRVWDIVLGTIVFTRALGQGATVTSQRMATTHLAVSERSKSFAVAGLAIADDHEGSAVLVFKPIEAKPAASYILRAGAVSGLTALSDGTGYAVLDSQAEIRTFTTHVVPVIGAPKGAVTNQAGDGAEALQISIAKEEDDEAPPGADKSGRMPAIEDEPQNIKSEELAKIFATGSGGLGLPNVKDMFDGVASLFAVRAR